MKRTILLILIFYFTTEITHCQKLNSICSKPITKPKIFGFKTCECVVDNSPEWGEQILIVNCAERELENLDLPVSTLPEETIQLDLSYNEFTKVPSLNGEQLKVLDLSYCQIQLLSNYDFVKQKNLSNLNLSNNKIQTVDENAFFGLSNLRMLDLSANKIQLLPSNVFVPMTNLNHFILSGNYELGHVLAQVGVDFYNYLGLNPNLETLEIERCNLTKINVARGSGLKTLYVGKNALIDFSELPYALETLDISENMNIEVITKDTFPRLSYLKLLLVQDMPDLISVESESFMEFTSLTHISFRGSMKLQHFDSNAFGDPENFNIPLEIVNFQGTNISNFNQSMAKVVSNLKIFDLEGIPLACDCNVAWLPALNVETNALCMEPPSLKGIMASGVPKRKYECLWFPKWVYTTFNIILILLILIGCSVGVWFIFSKLKRTTERHNVKVGSTSPYAPVTTVKTES